MELFTKATVIVMALFVLYQFGNLFFWIWKELKGKSFPSLLLSRQTDRK